MLKNFVLETSNAPGTSTTFNLGGAASGRLSYSGAGFTNGQLVFYVMDDGSQKEWGIGTFNTGSPNTMSRTTVVGNSVGTTAKLNFSGTTNVYNSLPAEYTAYINASNALEIGAARSITANNITLFRGHINGLITSRNVGTPNTKIDISAGAAMDEISQAGFITSSSVLTIDAATVGANGLDTGSLVLNAWYHIHLIGKPDGTVAGFLSTSLTPTLPSGYTLRRRVWSVKTDASVHFLAYTQNGEEGLWALETNDISIAPLTTAVLGALSVPPDIKVNALYRATYADNTNASGVLFTSPDETDQAAGTGFFSLQNPQLSSPFAVSGHFNTRTDVLGRIRYRSNGTTGAVTIKTYGWIDSRGKFA